MLLGALGVEAVSGLYQALKGQSGNETAAAFTPPDSQAVSLTAPQPPDGETAISRAASKMLRDLNSLLLGVQAANGNGGTAQPGTTTDPAAIGGTQKAAAHHHHRHAASPDADPSAAAANTGASSSASPADGGLAQLAKALSAYVQSATTTATATQLTA
jgi:hypothetical protein